MAFALAAAILKLVDNRDIRGLPGVPPLVSVLG
jgi:hypothetical protein